MEEIQAAKVIIALGTNISHSTNMSLALQRLGGMIADMKCSRKIWTAPIGARTETAAKRKFLNMLVSGQCALTLDRLHEAVKRIERECGRTDAEKAEGIIRMDIDVLKYGDTIEHAEDWQRDYIKTLIKEI